MSSKWHESIGEERRQADLTALALGQADETRAETDRNASGDQAQQIEDIREFAREVSTSLIEPVREPSAELRKKLQQHFDIQNPSHTRRYAEMTSNKNTSRKSSRIWLALAICALIAAVPLGLHWWSQQRQSKSEVSVVKNIVIGAAESSSNNTAGDVDLMNGIHLPFVADVDTRNSGNDGLVVTNPDVTVDCLSVNGVGGGGVSRTVDAGTTGSVTLHTTMSTIDNVQGDCISIVDFPNATIQNMEVNAGTNSALSIETTAGFVGDSLVTITNNTIFGDSDPAVHIVANSETASTLNVDFDSNVVTPFNDSLSVDNGPTGAVVSTDGANGPVTITSFDNNTIDDISINGTPDGTGGVLMDSVTFDADVTTTNLNLTAGARLAGGGITYVDSLSNHKISNSSGSGPVVNIKVARTEFNLDIADVQPQRNVELGTEQYKPIHENPFRSPSETRFAKSTFSIDVDTASYANVRRFLNQNRLPPPAAVRIEEMINYFDYDYPQPKGDTPFSVSTEVAECPWQPGHQLVRIGLKGKEIDSRERRPCNLVFLLDVSGSMSDQDKLPLLKRGLRMMLGELTEADRVTIVTYAGDAGLKLEATSGDQKKKLAAAIDSLQSGGSTNGSAGIHLAYEQAQQHFIDDGNNRVIMATDGDLNVGVTDDNELVELIRKKAADGVFLTVLGFGQGNLQDAKLEGLADNGNGQYAYVDSLREARKVLVDQATGSLVTIAKDVKIQVEFNPAEVASYRLIGYENRALANRDFKNDRRDAGDIGAGHTVTALYEIVPAKQADQPFAKADEPLKYQRPKKQPVVRASFTEAAGSGELLTVWLRYKEPDQHKSKKLEFVVKSSAAKFNRSSKDLQFAASVAAFGMLLRNSKHCRHMNFAAIEETAAGALGSDPKGYRTEFVDLVRRASSLRPDAGSIRQR